MYAHRLNTAFVSFSRFSLQRCFWWVILGYLYVHLVTILLLIVWTCNRQKNLDLATFIGTWERMVSSIVLTITVHASFRNRFKTFWLKRESVWWRLKSAKLVSFVISSVAFAAAICTTGIILLSNEMYLASSVQLNLTSAEKSAQVWQLSSTVINLLAYVKDFVYWHGMAVFLMKYNYVRSTLRTLQTWAKSIADGDYGKHLEIFSLYDECWQVMEQLRADYSFCVLLWVVRATNTQLFNLGYFCATRGSDTPIYIIAIVVLWCSLQLLYLTDVSHKADAEHSNLKALLVEAKLSLETSNIGRPFSAGVRRSQKMSEHRDFSFQVYGVFSLKRSLLVSINAFVVTNCVIIYQLSA